MSEQREYLQVPDLAIPESSINRIRLVSEGQAGKTLRAAEYAVFHEVVLEGDRLLKKDGFRIKPDIPVGDTALPIYMNCTDTALINLAICQAMGLKAAAMFSGGHASAIVESAETGSYWHLGGNIIPNVKFSKALGVATDAAKIETTELIVSGLSGESGAYLYKNMYEDSSEWRISEFEGGAIRAASPLGETGEIIDFIYAPAVVVGASLAPRMLHAIDVLGALEERRADDEVVREFAVAKKQLRHLVPKIS